MNLYKGLWISSMQVNCRYLTTTIHGNTRQEAAKYAQNSQNCYQIHAEVLGGVYLSQIASAGLLMSTVGMMLSDVMSIEMALIAVTENCRINSW